MGCTHTVSRLPVFLFDMVASHSSELKAELLRNCIYKIDCDHFRLLVNSFIALWLTAAICRGHLKWAMQGESDSLCGIGFRALGEQKSMMGIVSLGLGALLPRLAKCACKAAATGRACGRLLSPLDAKTPSYCPKIVPHEESVVAASNAGLSQDSRATIGRMWMSPSLAN